MLCIIKETLERVEKEKSKSVWQNTKSFIIYRKDYFNAQCIYSKIRLTHTST